MTDDGENDEESVEELLERAESMIRENMHQINPENVESTSVGVVNNGWLNAQQGNSAENTSGHSNTTSGLEYSNASRKLRKQ